MAAGFRLMTLILYKPFSASQEYFLNLNVSFLFFYLLIIQFLEKRVRQWQI